MDIMQYDTCKTSSIFVSFLMWLSVNSSYIRSGYSGLCSQYKAFHIEAHVEWMSEQMRLAFAPLHVGPQLVISILLLPHPFITWVLFSCLLFQWSISASIFAYLIFLYMKCSPQMFSIWFKFYRLLKTQDKLHFQPLRTSPPFWAPIASFPWYLPLMYSVLWQNFLAFISKTLFELFMC